MSSFMSFEGILIFEPFCFYFCLVSETKIAGDECFPISSGSCFSSW